MAALTFDQLTLLRIIHAKVGRKAKALIREGWQTGNYDARLLVHENAAQMLQQLRNTRGPSWLERTSFAAL
jgi:hypothetical protein